MEAFAAKGHICMSRMRASVAALATALAVALLPSGALGATHRPAGRRAQAPSAGHCANTQLVPSEDDTRLVIAATLCLVNRERSAHHAQPLRENPYLARAAQRHNESMLAQNYVEHVGPEGSTPDARIEASGYLRGAEPGYESAENIGWGSGSEATPAAVVARWMASPPHRASILDGHLRDSGIGVAAHLPACLGAAGAGAIYTQDFAVLLGG